MKKTIFIFSIIYFFSLISMHNELVVNKFRPHIPTQNVTLEAQSKMLRFYAYNGNYPMVKAAINAETEENRKARRDVFLTAGCNEPSLFYDAAQCIKIYKQIVEEEFIVKAVEQNNINACKVALACRENIKGLPLLHIALMNCYENIATLLLSFNDAKINREKETNVIPLHLAFFKCSINIFTTLLNKSNLKVNAQDNDGLSILHHACSWNAQNILQLLLKHADINVNIQHNDTGYTPLHVASELGCEMIVRMLLGHKTINPHIQNKNNKTPRDLALTKNFQSIVSIFDAYNREKPSR
jgi:ankyrin repeat protein